MGEAEASPEASLEGRGSALTLTDKEQLAWQ